MNVVGVASAASSQPLFDDEDDDDDDASAFLFSFEMSFLRVRVEN